MGNYFDKFKNAGVPFMEGREKGNLQDVLDEPLHIVGFGFLNGDDGKYAVMMFAEHPDQFYFGNSIITEMLETVDEDGAQELLAEQVIVFRSKLNASGKRRYTTYSFDC